jgi:hypothetical protein
MHDPGLGIEVNSGCAHTSLDGVTPDEHDFAKLVHPERAA